MRSRTCLKCFHDSKSAYTEVYGETRQYYIPWPLHSHSAYRGPGRVCACPPPKKKKRKKKKKKEEENIQVTIKLNMFWWSRVRKWFCYLCTHTLRPPVFSGHAMVLLCYTSCSARNSVRVCFCFAESSVGDCVVNGKKVRQVYEQQSFSISWWAMLFVLHMRQFLENRTKSILLGLHPKLTDSLFRLFAYSVEKIKEWMNEWMNV